MAFFISMCHMSGSFGLIMQKIESEMPIIWSEILDKLLIAKIVV